MANWEKPVFLQGISKNSVHGIFLHGKAKNAVFAFLHFQSLVVIENGGTSLRRAGASIFRGALQFSPADAKCQSRSKAVIPAGQFQDQECL
jgi:hypothetical protein